MNLHELLRDLVARQGPSVVDSAEGFRAALDDFLTEDEATTGELNLLVDAVRIGGVQRLHSIIEHGGDPRAAVAEAGDTFARDRGTEDFTRCRWAVAVVGYALGWLEEADIPPQSMSVPPSTPTPTPTPTPAPAAQPSVSLPSPPGTELPPRTHAETGSVHEPPTAPVAVPLPGPPPGPPRRRTGGVVLIVLLALAVIAGAVGVGIWLSSADDEPKGEVGAGTGSESVSSKGSPSIGDAIPANDAVVPIADENGDARIYAVDVDTGAQVPLTSGPNDRVPSVSPDRRTVMYVVNTPGSGDATPMVLDLASRETRPLLTDESPCESGGRPGFNPSGDQVVLACYDSEGSYTATYVLDLQGGEVGTVPVPPDREPQGTPTWTSNTTLVFSMAGETDDEPAMLWAAQVNGEAPTQLTFGEDGLSDTHPDWSGEAGLLLFSHHPVKDFFGALLTADATQQEGPRTQDAQWESPAWSPDGTRVLFIERTADGTERLATAPLDDLSDVAPIPGIDGEVGVPAWGTR